MSTWVVLDVIVKGLKVVAELVSAGKSFTDIVTWLLPSNTLKFGKNQVTISVKDFPADSSSATALSPLQLHLVQLKLTLEPEDVMQILK